MNEFPKHNPVRCCILCGCPTRGTVGVLDGRKGFAISAPLCSLHADEPGSYLRRAEAALDQLLQRLGITIYPIERCGPDESTFDILLNKLDAAGCKPRRKRRGHDHPAE